MRGELQRHCCPLYACRLPHSAASLHNPTLDPKCEYQHCVLKERADLAHERLAPVVLPGRLLTPGRTRNPPRRLVLVVQIIAPEGRLEHSFLVPDYQLVLDRKEQHGKRHEPQYSRDGDESHPDQKVSM